MSFNPLVMDLEMKGDEALAVALRNAPGLVSLAAEQAGRRAAAIVQPAIASVTPVRTGFLRSSEDVGLPDAFHVVFTAGAFYASFVERRQHFLERGVASVETSIGAIYEHVFDHLSESFGSEP